MPARAPQLAPTNASAPPPIDTALDAAVEWMTLLMSGDATTEERLRWESWRQASPHHAAAWARVESVFGRMKSLEAKAAYQALSPYGASAVQRQRRRRAILKAMVLGGTALGIGGIATRSDVVLAVAADFSTAKGETRNVTLADGTRLMLDTETAIAVRYRAEQRVVTLLRGQLRVQTQPFTQRDAAAAPFVLSSEQGDIRAVDADFVARLHDRYASCAVERSTVDIVPADDSAHVRHLDAGQQTCFTRASVDEPSASKDSMLAWLHGQIVADNMRLADFAAELNRYRPGVIRVAPAVADLRLSGVYPVADTERVIASAARTLHVHVRRWTRYWVMFERSPTAG
ncbi:DUF4880 domain-containing protein [Pandoraea captiosa]|nr:DUF4880 domain-containing protein [Pandoraea captiosa]